MNIHQILKYFSTFSNLTPDEVIPWIPFCSACMEEISRNIKSGVDLETNEKRLNILSAQLAFYKYTLYRASGVGMQSFSAGDIRIIADKKTSVDNATKMWNETRAGAADILEDSQFIFERIV